VKYSGWLVVLLVATTAVLSGCAGGAADASARYGQRAVDLAHRVPDCSKVRPFPAKTDRSASAATCLIDRHQVVFLAWKNAAAASGPITVALPSAQANGETWNASVSDDASLLVQRRIATKIVSAPAARFRSLADDPCFRGDRTSRATALPDVCR
jgi:hypothetical protein